MNGPPATIATPRRCAERQQRGQRRLVGERVTAREQDHVQVGRGQRVEAHLHVVDAEAVAPSAPSAFRCASAGSAPSTMARKRGGLVGAVRVDVDVVHIRDVDARKRSRARLSSSERSVPSYE